jgi:hypothetical protein
MMRLFYAVAAIGLWATAANSAPLSFTCNVAKGLCTCDINWPGDCDAMKKNCSDGKIGWCSAKGKCSCTTAKVNPRPGMGPANPPTIRQ